jgi:GntR family transcriptional regulator, transcriptional repressor for pyruvate dehydrogenase complex
MSVRDVPLRPRLSEQLVSELLDMIQGDVIRPGAKLPTEAQLAARFDVSRTVVREAISQLRAEGIVRSSQGRGTFVLAMPGEAGAAVIGDAPTDLAGMLSLLEFRTAIEVESSGLAARRRTAQQLAHIAAALEDFGGAGDDPAAAVDADFAFHSRIARASANVHLAASLEALGTASLAIPRARLRSSPEYHRRAYEEHAAIHTAIVEADTAAAAAAMRTHLVNSAARLRLP